MKNTRTVLTLLFLFFLVACGSGDADEDGSAGVTPETGEPTEVAVATATDVPPTATATLEPTATATAEPTATATTAPTATPEAVDSECVSCHADQELLVQIAEPEEAHDESESSGPG